MKTYLDVINETVEYYSKDPINLRSIDEDNNSCVYYNLKNGNMCAVGRYLNKPKGFEDQDLTAHTLFRQYGFECIIKPEYSHLDYMDFWNRLQRFHDCSLYWDLEDNVISEAGINFVSRMKEEYERV